MSDGAGVALEVAVASERGAGAAHAGGADRVELCTALELGGLTASQGLVESAVAHGLPVHALVRCRPGDFVYDDHEIALMTSEIGLLLASGVRGVVVGALNVDGALDRRALTRFVDAARSARADCEVTLHRAVDHAVDPVAAVAQLDDLRIDRVLTSGAAPTAPEGSSMLSRMRHVAGPVQVMAGAGVRPQDIRALVLLGVNAVHLSAKRAVEARWSGAVSLGSADTGGARADHFATDAAIVAAARTELNTALSSPAAR